LQQAIGDKEFCIANYSYGCYPYSGYGRDVYWNDSCNTVGSIKTDCKDTTNYCLNGGCCYTAYGTDCPTNALDRACIATFGTFNCEGQCIGATYNPSGTVCGKACCTFSNGKCIGWYNLYCDAYGSCHLT